MKLYKLTNQDMFTRNDCRWTIGEKIELPVVPNPQLCSDQVLHSYKSLDLGLLLNPIHADIKNPRCFEAEGDICVEDYGKAGSPTLVLTKEIPLPQWYQDIKWRKTVQIRFAILCAESVLHLFETKFPDDNRPREAIKAAKNFLGATADASDAAHAADAAVYAAYVAADAAAHTIIDFAKIACIIK